MTAIFRRKLRHDRGFTLVELLIAGMLIVIVGGMLATLTASVAQSTSSTRAAHNLNEEARNAINRMSRELRQASLVTYAVNPDGPAHVQSALTAVSFEADFNGDGCAGNGCSGTDQATNPESLTYCSNPGDPDVSRRAYLWLIPVGVTSAPTTCDIAGAQPILAGQVKTFELEYRSHLYRFDTSGDGITTWRELDSAPPPVGEGASADGDINTHALLNVNSVVLRLTMKQTGRTQVYTTQVDLRNRS